MQFWFKQLNNIVTETTKNLLTIVEHHFCLMLIFNTFSQIACEALHGASFLVRAANASHMEGHRSLQEQGRLSAFCSVLPGPHWHGDLRHGAALSCRSLPHRPHVSWHPYLVRNCPVLELPIIQLNQCLIIEVLEIHTECI